MSDTPTPDEIRRVLAHLQRRECIEHGHSWTVLETPVRPFAVDCTRCGIRWEIAA